MIELFTILVIVMGCDYQLPPKGKGRKGKLMPQSALMKNIPKNLKKKKEIGNE